MNTHVFDRRFTLYERRCYACGKFWASEREASGQCPSCASDEITRACNDRDILATTVSRLRGVITRMKKTKGTP
jgi:predicted RNA-binding Zn-ribbon protein involved in translation (DUF1610 family)